MEKQARYYMEKNILRVLGNLIAVQQKHELTSLGAFNQKPFVLALLSYGKWDFECPMNDTVRIEKYRALGRDCRMAGLEITESTDKMSDGEWSHSGTNYITSYKMTVRLPISPAVEVLYAKTQSR